LTLSSLIDSAGKMGDKRAGAAGDSELGLRVGDRRATVLVEEPEEPLVSSRIQ
jgi:hypothetical protein